MKRYLLVFSLLIATFAYGKIAVKTLRGTNESIPNIADGQRITYSFRAFVVPPTTETLVTASGRFMRNYREYMASADSQIKINGRFRLTGINVCAEDQVAAGAGNVIVRVRVEANGGTVTTSSPLVAICGEGLMLDTILELRKCTSCLFDMGSAPIELSDGMAMSISVIGSNASGIDAITHGVLYDK